MSVCCACLSDLVLGMLHADNTDVRTYLAPVTKLCCCYCCCRFPGADPTGAGANELAPGMCAEVSVCFTPDTLGDYADAFAVQTQLGRFEVALRGSRPHPRLSLPDELQVRRNTRPACLRQADMR